MCEGGRRPLRATRSPELIETRSPDRLPDTLRESGRRLLDPPKEVGEAPVRRPLVYLTGTPARCLFQLPDRPHFHLLDGRPGHLEQLADLPLGLRLPAAQPEAQADDLSLPLGQDR